MRVPGGAGGMYCEIWRPSWSTGSSGSISDQSGTVWRPLGCLHSVSAYHGIAEKRRYYHAIIEQRHLPRTMTLRRNVFTRRVFIAPSVVLAVCALHFSSLQRYRGEGGGGGLANATAEVCSVRISRMPDPPMESPALAASQRDGDDRRLVPSLRNAG